VKQSASCPPPDDSGFTLIEIVVALAVVGLIVGMVIPVATGWLYRLGQSSQLQGVEDALADLSAKARRSGRTISLRSIAKQSDARPTTGRSALRSIRSVVRSSIGPLSSGVGLLAIERSEIVRPGSACFRRQIR